MTITDLMYLIALITILIASAGLISYYISQFRNKHIRFRII